MTHRHDDDTAPYAPHAAPRQSVRVSRRRALGLLGATSLMTALPLLPPRRAFAEQGGKPPLRLLFFHFPAGLLRDEWAPRQATSETSWELSDIMRPLQSSPGGQNYKDRVKYFKHLDMLAGFYDPTNPINAHAEGSTQYMTSHLRKPGYGSLSQGLSIDQFIAKALNTPEPISRLSSLEVINDNGYHSLSSWGGNGARLPVMQDAKLIYKRLYGASSGGGAAEQDRAMSFLQRRYERLAGKLERASDKEVIEAHLELKLAMHARSKVTTPLDHHALSQEALESLISSQSGESIWQSSYEVNMQLVVNALRSGATRVASIGLGVPPQNEEFGWQDGWRATNGAEVKDWHGLDHEVSKGPNNIDANFKANTAPYNAKKAQHELFIRKLARLLDVLDGIEEGEGTLLDNTLIVCVSHIANGNHQLSDLPWMVIGDAQGFFKPGARYFELDRQPHPRHPDDMSKTVGRGHGDLFASVAHAMGVTDLTGFGTEEVPISPISEMLA